MYPPLSKGRGPVEKSLRLRARHFPLVCKKKSCIKNFETHHTDLHIY